MVRERRLRDRDPAQPGARRDASRRRQALRAARHRRPRRDRPHLDRDDRGDAAHPHRRRRDAGLEAPVADLLRGAVAPFVAPLAHVAARGNNLYFPFPFARHCLVTVDDIVSADPFTGRPMGKLYYQIGYRRYRAEDAARVRPTSAAELARAAPTIGRVAKILRDGPPAPPGRDGGPVSIEATTVQPGRASVTTSPRRPAAVRSASCASRRPNARPRSCGRRA